MTELRKAAEMALECLDYHWDNPDSDLEDTPYVLEAKQALRQALAPEVTPEVNPEVNEPEGWVKIDEVRRYLDSVGCGTIYKTAGEGRVPLYAAPQREWVGLSDEEVIKCFDSVAFGQVEDDLIIKKHVNIFRAIHYIEAKLKEKNSPEGGA